MSRILSLNEETKKMLQLVQTSRNRDIYRSEILNKCANGCNTAFLPCLPPLFSGSGVWEWGFPPWDSISSYIYRQALLTALLSAFYN